MKQPWQLLHVSVYSCVALSSSNKSVMEKVIPLQGSLKYHRSADITVTHDDTHCNHLWVDTQVFPISTAHVSQHAARWERGQEVANARPRGVASAAEVGGDSVIHPVHILLLQKGCVGMATG